MYNVPLKTTQISIFTVINCEWLNGFKLATADGTKRNVLAHSAEDMTSGGRGSDRLSVPFTY